MRKFSYTIVKPVSIDRLVEICNEMKGKSRDESIEWGKSIGLTKHIVDSLRQILGYSNPEQYKHLSAEEREQIADEYREGGVSMNELARRHGIGYNSVRCILVNRDVMVTTSKAWTKRQEMFLLNELRRGTPNKQIADMMGKRPSCIRQKIKRMKRDGIIKG